MLAKADEMTRSSEQGTARHRLRARALRVGIAASVAIAVSAVSAGDTISSAPPTTASQRLQQRFAAAVEGWRKSALLALPEAAVDDARKAALRHVESKPRSEPDAHAARVLRELRVVVTPTPLPLLRAQRQLSGYSIVVSAGWLALLHELLLAEALSQPAAAAIDAGAPASSAASGAVRDDGDCLQAFQREVWRVVADNRCRAAEAPPRPLRAWPRLASWVGSSAAPKACSHLRPGAFRRPELQARIDDGADIATLWLLTRHAAQLVAQPVPRAAVAAAGDTAASASAVPAHPQRAALRCEQSPPTLSLAASVPAPAAPGVNVRRVPLPLPSPSPTDHYDQRALQVLADYGMAQPRALQWLRENGALFDADTEVQAAKR